MLVVRSIGLQNRNFWKFQNSFHIVLSAGVHQHELQMGSKPRVKDPWYTSVGSEVQLRDRSASLFQKREAQCFPFGKHFQILQKNTQIRDLVDFFFVSKRKVPYCMLPRLVFFRSIENVVFSKSNVFPNGFCVRKKVLPFFLMICFDRK